MRSSSSERKVFASCAAQPVGLPLRVAADQPGLPGEVAGLLRRHQDRLVEAQVVEVGRYPLIEDIECLHPACGT